MKWGEYTVFIKEPSGMTGNFFSGTLADCKLVEFGMKLAGKETEIIKAENYKPPQ